MVRLSTTVGQLTVYFLLSQRNGFALVKVPALCGEPMPTSHCDPTSGIILNELSPSAQLAPASNSVNVSIGHGAHSVFFV